MEFIKNMMEHVEEDFLGFKGHKPIDLSNGASLVLGANSLSECSPKEDLDFDKYETMEVKVMHLGSPIVVNEDEPIKAYLQSDNTYTNVPVAKIEEFYQLLAIRDDVEDVKVEEDKKEIESVKVEKEAEPKKKLAAKKKITKKAGSKKVNDIKDALNKKFFEREDEVEGMLVALLSGQHVLLIGEPGTGKSLLSMELANIIDGSEYFQWLLTKYTTPEELFGALSLKELEKGVHVRNVNNKLPVAHLGFLDEIFKSNSAILNSLLTLINERIYYNNGTPIESPLISLIGASNEYPEEDEGLEAMFDRLLLRYEVQQVRDRKNFISMLKNEGADIKVPSLTLEELYEVQKYTRDIVVSDKLYSVIADICQDLEDEGIRPSARRVKNSIEAIKAKTYIDGRTHAEEKDLLILNHILWNEIGQKEDAIHIIKQYAQDVVQSTIERVKSEAKDIVGGLSARSKSDGSDYTETMEVAKKLKYLTQELDTLLSDNPDRKKEINPILKDISDSQQKIVDEVLSPIPADVKKEALVF